MAMTEGIDADSAAAAADEPVGGSWPAVAKPTGDSVVDAVLSRLHDVPGVPVGAQGGLYEDIHDGLMTALDADPSSAPAGPPMPPPPGSANSDGQDGS